MYNPLSRLGVRQKPAGVMEALGFGPAMMQATPSTLDDELAAQGQGTDSLIAHISPREALILKQLGGSGSINPRTGLLSFEDGDGGDSDGGDSDGGDSDSSSSDGSDSGVDGGSQSGMGGPGGDESSGTGSAGTGQSSTSGAFGSNDVGDPGGGIGSAGTGDAFGIGSQEAQDTMTSPEAGVFSGIMDDYTSKETLSNIPGMLLQDVAPTLGAILGAISPMPFGSIIGYNIGKAARDYGFSEPSPETVAEMASGGTGQGSSGEPMPNLASPIVPGRTSVAGSNSPGSTSSWTPDMQAMWDRIANQGGGNLDKLYKGAIG
jgi:hypothetical protein